MPALAIIGMLLAVKTLAQAGWSSETDARLGPTCVAVSLFLENQSFFEASVRDVRNTLPVGDRKARLGAADEVARYAKATHDAAFGYAMEMSQPVSIDIHTIRPIFQSLAREQDRASAEMSAMMNRLGANPATAHDYAVITRYEQKRRAITGPYLDPGPCGVKLSPPAKQRR